MATKTNEIREKRDNGTGTIYQRDNGKWVGKIYVGRKEDGKPKFKFFSGKTQGEVKKKIREHNQSSSNLDIKKVSVESYLRNWLKTYKKGTIKDSSYDALEKTALNQVIPNIGMIQLQQLTSDDIQILLKDLKKQGYSYSTVKKAHDCINAMIKHAVIAGDVDRNPMLLVKMLAESEFEKKEIRFFTQEECSLIVEESSRQYKTGAPVYVYGDAYVLMLHTGIRLGEAIGLEKSDWDENNKTLHIRRNIQSITKRDDSGERVKGRELVCNTTKTYSGDRILPLNKSATEALERLCNSCPESKHIICSRNGNMIPPERLERTFYRILNNLKIDKTGLHSLRHTFASMLFANKADIKTISHLLGHASIQITLNTYIHLVKEPDKEAVAILDEII